MKTIVVGLGNPGKEYENTYHNAGALLMRVEVRGLRLEGVEFKKYKNLFEYLEADNVVFVQPLIFMNDSGKAVQAAIKKFYPSILNPQSSSLPLIIYQDDSDIPIGEFKISFARNSAGHKGVQSIIDALKIKEFTRVRIGIRPTKDFVTKDKETKRQKAGEFALKQITAKDKATLEKVFKEIINTRKSS